MHKPQICIHILYLELLANTTMSHMVTCERRAAIYIHYICKSKNVNVY